MVDTFRHYRFSKEQEHTDHIIKQIIWETRRCVIRTNKAIKEDEYWEQLEVVVAILHRVFRKALLRNV